MRFLSLFSGIEAASEAWVPLGWECVAVAEIDKHACNVLRARHPHVRNLGNVQKITEADIAALGHLDLIVFGSPCQDLSNAGKQKGFAGERSGLFFPAVDIVRHARRHCGARFALWENVPGAFSSNKGRDFAAVVDALSGLVGTPVPPKGWGTEGCAVGPEAMVEWGVLDAQWFGVAQRRRRVFALADFGNWAGRPPILLEPQGLRGDSAPRRKAREETAGAVADGTGVSGAGGPVLTCVSNAEGGHPPVFLTASNLGKTVNNQTPLLAFNGRARPDEMRFDPAVTASLTVGQAESSCVVLPFDTTQITSKTNRSNPQAGDPCHPLAAGAHAPAVAYIEDVAPTLLAGGSSPASHGKKSGQDRETLVAYTTKLHNTKANNAGKLFEEYATCLDANSPPPALLTAYQVRRLTPVECERLQGFRDGHTDVGGVTVVQDDGTTITFKKTADGPRYKSLGNSMAVPAMQWIGERIELALLFQE